MIFSTGSRENLNIFHMEASKPKLVKPILNIIGINSLRLGGLQLLSTLSKKIYSYFFTRCYIRDCMQDSKWRIKPSVLFLSYTMNKIRKLTSIYFRG